MLRLRIGLALSCMIAGAVLTVFGAAPFARLLAWALRGGYWALDWTEPHTLLYLAALVFGLVLDFAGVGYLFRVLRSRSRPEAASTG